MLKKMKSFMLNESGQGLVEYVLIIALVAIAVIILLNALGSEVGDTLQEIIDALRGRDQIEDQTN